MDAAYRGGGGGIHSMTDVFLFVKYQTHVLLWLKFFLINLSCYKK